jgi:hypothetical protein
MRSRSIVPLTLALLFIVIGAVPSLAGPPEDATWQGFFPAGSLCDFDVELLQTGKMKYTELPNDRYLLTWPALKLDVINSVTSQQVRLTATGPMHVTVQADGEITMSTGRGPFGIPGLGFIMYIGNFVYEVDSNGNMLGQPYGHGRMLDICAMID